MNLDLTDHAVRLWGERRVLVTAGYRVVGPPALLPDETRPGAFRVWWPVRTGDGPTYRLLHVTPDDRAVWLDRALPEHLITTEE